MQLYARGRRRAGIAGATALLLAAGVGFASPAQASQSTKSTHGDIGGGAAISGSAAQAAAAAADSAAEGYGLTTAQQRAVDTAVDRARTSGKAVPISALTTETWQVVAEPNGKLDLQDTPLPARALKKGTWQPIDTALARNANGTYTAETTAYATVTFSGGGTGALATSTTPAGASYAVSWPGTLPAPTVTSDAALYHDVLPGVDLQVSATANGGFSEVLIVRNAQAAANPRLSRLSLGVHETGITPSQTSALGIASGSGTGADGDLELSLGQAAMWDSNTAISPQAVAHQTAPGSASSAQMSASQLAKSSASDPSTATAPGMAAHESALGLSANSSSLTITPNTSLLRGKGTVFPVFMDPSPQWHPASGGTPAYDEVKQDSPCSGQPYYNDTGEDENSLGVGYADPDYSCGGWQNTYYQWKLPSAIWGATVNTAAINVVENWQASFSCSTSRTVTASWSGGIGSGTDYDSQPGPLSGSSAYSNSQTVGAAYNPSGCTDPETSDAGFSFTHPIQVSADNHYSQITVELTGDGNDDDFSRFQDNPSLNIEYDHAPNTPGASQLQAVNGASNTVACATSSPYPVIGKSIASNTTELKANDITSPDGDQLQADFQYWTSSDSTPATGDSANNLASGASAQLSLPSSFTNGLTSGETVYWNVRTYNGNSYSGWSPTCAFTAEPTAPNPPTIDANTTYPEGTTGAAAGTSATFQISGSSTGTTATKFYYDFDRAPATSGTPAAETVDATSNAASVTETPLSPGPHTLYVDAVDAAGDVSATATYQLIAAQHTTVTCASLSACYDNTAISANTAMTKGDADGGNSFSATDWTNAGWASNGHITVDGASLTLPVYGTGLADNALAYGQSITCSTSGITCAVPSTGASSLTFLVTTTDAGSFHMPSSVAGDNTAPYVQADSPVAGTYYNDLNGSGSLNTSLGVPTGCIYYTGSTGTCNSYVLSVPDWVSPGSTSAPNIATMVFPNENTQSGTAITTNHPKVYAFSVPLAAGQTISSVTLPDVSNGAGGVQSLHVFSIGTRDTTVGTVEANDSIVSTTAGDTWTGAWSSDTEGDYAPSSGSYTNQSFRILLQPTVTGSTIRIKLDNSLGTSALTIGHVTIAGTTGTAVSPTAATSTTPVSLAFGGSEGTTIPAGGMVYSDPLSYSVTNGRWVAVSVYLSSTSAELPQHSFSQFSYEYMAPTGSDDNTLSTSASPYTASGGSNGAFTNLVTGLDVQTAGEPTQVVIGDNLIDAWDPNTAPLSPNNGDAIGLSQDLVTAGTTTPSTYQSGVINAGIESNQILASYADTINGTAGGIPVGGPSLLDRIDRDVLDEPGVTNAVLDEGLEDVLAEQPTTAAAVTTDSDAFENGALSILLSYLKDVDAQETTITAVGMTPCIGYSGSGAASGNDPCTADVDAVRTSVNGWLSGNPGAVPNYQYVNPDTTIGVSASSCPSGDTGCVALNALAMVGTSRDNTPSDPVNLTNAGWAGLADAILAPQDVYQLNDGNASTSAGDEMVGNSDLYLAAADPNITALSSGAFPLALNGTEGTDYGWTTSTVGAWSNQTVLEDETSNGYGYTGAAGTSNGEVLATGGGDSFSVSAWADLSAIPTHNASVVGESGTEASAFYLQYNEGHNAWCFDFMQTDTASAPGDPTAACASSAPSTGTWYHLVGVYDGATQTASLYVNSTLVGTGTGIVPWSPTSSTNGVTIGGAQYDASMTDAFPGDISDVQLYNYALDAPQVSALHDQLTQLSPVSN